MFPPLQPTPPLNSELSHDTISVILKIHHAKQSIELILCESEWEFSFFITIDGTLSFLADITFRVS